MEVYYTEGAGRREETVRDYNYWEETAHDPIMIEEYDSDEEFQIHVKYEWIGSPRRDFTVKVYSFDGNDVVDEIGLTNMLHTDGNQPSEFDYIAEMYGSNRVAEDVRSASDSDNSEDEEVESEGVDL